MLFYSIRQELPMISHLAVNHHITAACLPTPQNL
jgi:hypothetical protein